MTDNTKANGWSEWAHRVLGDIERIEERQEEMNKNIQSQARFFGDIGRIETTQGEMFRIIQAQAIEIAILKTKAAMIGGVWGAIIGAIVSIVVAMILHKVGM